MPLEDVERYENVLVNIPAKSLKNKFKPASFIHKLRSYIVYWQYICRVRKSLLLVRNVERSVEDIEKCKNVMVSTRAK